MNFISCYNAEVVVGTKINDALFQLQFPESIAFPALLQFPVQKIFIHIFVTSFAGQTGNEK
jgi:hypothetical protein